MILAVDTATHHVVIGLLTPAGATERVVRVDRAHAERIADLVSAVLHDAAGSPSRIVVGTGPGSYTGVRVGASFCLGLGRALGCPVTGVSTLEAIAARAEGRVAVSLDARKGMVYGGVYHVLNGIVTRAELPAAKWTRDEFATHADGITWIDDEQPSGAALARLGASRGVDNWQLEYL